MTTKNENQDPRGDKGTVESIRPWGDIHMVVRNQRCSVDLTHEQSGAVIGLGQHLVVKPDQGKAYARVFGP